MQSGFSMMTWRARARGGERGAVMQEVRQADVDDVAVGFADQRVEIAEPSRDLPVRRKCLGPRGAAREDGRHLRIRHEAGVGLEVDVGDETGAEDGDFGRGHEFLQWQG